MSEVQTPCFKGRGLNKVVTHTGPHFQRLFDCDASCLCRRENVIESQRSRMEELEGASELLREELRRKEAEYEERLLQVRQEQTSKLRYELLVLNMKHSVKLSGSSF